MSSYEVIGQSQTAPKLVVILEKKGRGRGMGLIKTWTGLINYFNNYFNNYNNYNCLVRTFKLNGLQIQYFDKDKLKGY